MGAVWQVVSDPSAGSAQRGQTLRVCAIGGQQNGGDGHSTTAQVCPCPECIPTVVSGPDQ
jgi:hypothetical protein